MKIYLLLIFCIVFHFGAFAQNAENIALHKTAIQKLKLQAPTFARDTLLIKYYYELAVQQADTDVKITSAYIDSLTILSNKIKWKKANQWLHQTISNLASKKGALGLWDESNELILKEIQYYRSKNDSVNLNETLIWWANSLWDMGKYDQSLKILQDCLPFAKAKNDLKLLSLIYSNLGYNYISKKMYPEAQSSFEKAYFYFTKGNFEQKYTLRMLAQLKTYLIESYLLNRQRVRAEKMIPWVENTTKLYGTNFEKYYSYSLLTFAYIEIGDYKKAEKYALKCAFFAKPLASNAHDLMVNTYFYKIYKGLGKNDLALKHLEELKKVETAIAFDKMNAKVTELQLKYDTEAKQKEIDQLTIKQQNQTQKSLLAGLGILIAITGYVFWNYRKLLHKNHEISEAMLQGQTTERRRVAIDLHDNLGSTLSSIGWSMDAIDQSKMTKSEQKIYQNLKEMILTAYNEVRLLSHNLLPEELEKQGLVVALQTFVRKLNKNTKTHFELQMPQNFNRLDKRTEFELYTIILELVNNILKHSHATNASIIFEPENQNLKLSITDNGRGLFENNSDGKGLKNVQARVESLRGKWVIKSKENEGTNSIITIPI